MGDQVIKCPHCQMAIPLSEALSHQITENLRAEFETRAKTKEAQIETKARAAVSVELKDLHAQMAEKTKALKGAEQTELELRKRRRDLEEKEKTWELEMARRIDEERRKIHEEALKSAHNDHRLKDAEKEKQIDEMRKQIDELRRKAEQGSQQTQGEVLELQLEEMLRAKFPFDLIEPVSTGKRGADVLQRVRTPVGGDAGTIIWESKRTKAFSDGWIDKLKDDQRAAKAEMAVLLTTTLPKDVSGFALVKGVWVTDFSSCLGLATALRLNLMDVAMTKLATTNQGDKMEHLYNYLSGPEFKQRVQAIVEAFDSMHRDLEQEKRAMTKIWSKREKQIDRIVNSTAGMYGDVQGIIGASLPQIEELELETLTAGEKEPIELETGE